MPPTGHRKLHNFLEGLCFFIFAIPFRTDLALAAASAFHLAASESLKGYVSPWLASDVAVPIHIALCLTISKCSFQALTSVAGTRCSEAPFLASLSASVFPLMAASVTVATSELIRSLLGLVGWYPHNLIHSRVFECTHDHGVDPCQWSARRNGRGDPPWIMKTQGWQSIMYLTLPKKRRGAAKNISVSMVAW